MSTAGPFDHLPRVRGDARRDDDLPLVCLVADVAWLLRYDVLQLEPLIDRLPPPLDLPGERRWERQTILDWLRAGARAPGPRRVRNSRA